GEANDARGRVHGGPPVAGQLFPHRTAGRYRPQEPPGRGQERQKAIWCQSTRIIGPLLSYRAVSALCYPHPLPAGTRTAPTTTLAHIAARIKRLEKLGMAFAKEQFMIAQGDDPLLYLERQEYLRALRDAVAGVETARVVLAKARQRLTRRQ